MVGEHEGPAREPEKPPWAGLVLLVSISDLRQPLIPFLEQEEISGLATDALHGLVHLDPGIVGLSASLWIVTSGQYSSVTPGTDTSAYQPYPEASSCWVHLDLGMTISTRIAELKCPIAFLTIPEMSTAASSDVIKESGLNCTSTPESTRREIVTG